MNEIEIVLTIDRVESDYRRYAYPEALVRATDSCGQEIHYRVPINTGPNVGSVIRVTVAAIDPEETA